VRAGVVRKRGGVGGGGKVRVGWWGLSPRVEEGGWVYWREVRAGGKKKGEPGGGGGAVGGGRWGGRGGGKEIGGQLLRKRGGGEVWVGARVV